MEDNFTMTSTTKRFEKELRKIKWLTNAYVLHDVSNLLKTVNSRILEDKIFPEIRW